MDSYPIWYPFLEEFSLVDQEILDKLLYSFSNLSPKELEKVIKNGGLRNFNITPYLQRSINRALLLALSSKRQNYPLWVGIKLKTQLIDMLKTHYPKLEAEVAGSIRRGEEMIDKIVIITSDQENKVTSKDIGALIASKLKNIRNESNQKAEIIIAETKIGLPVYIHLVPREEYAFYLWENTSPSEHIKVIKERLPQDDYDFYSEEDIYRRADLPYIPAEVRSAALPKLEDIVNLPEKEDILGDWHVHTIASDGADTIENLGEEARRLGYKFLAICDHSKSVKGGIGEDMVKEEIKRIKDWNKKNDKVRLLGGIELEILEEGKLDFPSSITDDLDIVIGAIHHGYQDSIENLNERICYALQSGRINILGHLTGRLIQQRAPYPLDFLRIFALAEKMGTALEVNAHAIRMDLNVPLIRLAKNYNIKVAISSDAHIKWELSMIELGLILIRKALLRRNSLLFPKDITKF